MRRVVVVLLGLILGLAGPAAAKTVTTEAALAEMVLGKADAPVTIIEYSSLTCPHCASFHRDVLPSIKKEYIDTGKVRLVSRDFPLGGLALAAAVLTRCAGPDRYFGFLEVLFRSQDTWARSDNPREALLKVSRFAGLSAEDFDQCLDNETLVRTVQARAREAAEKFDIESTPTFIVNGEKVSDNPPVEEFRKILDRALAKKK